MDKITTKTALSLSHNHMQSRDKIEKNTKNLNIINIAKKLVYIIGAFGLSGNIALGAQSPSNVKLGTSVVTATGFSTDLNELNRNVYVFDNQEINSMGDSSAGSYFARMPFIGQNNFGLGTNVDLRGQGNKANVSLNVLYNGVSLNMLDSSHGVTPLDSIDLNNIQKIEVLPGGGAVLYGNGTRGGVINIITQKRYDKPLIIGDAKINLGHNNGINIGAKVGDKLDDSTHYSIAVKAQYEKGYRELDKTYNGNISFGLLKDIGDSQNIGLDVSYFSGIIHTTPGFSTQEEAKNNRYGKGLGEIVTLQDRISSILFYENTINDSFILKANAFYHYNKNKYKSNEQWMTTRGMSVPFYQDGSYFIDNKFGAEIKGQIFHDNGELIAGISSIYNIGQRYMDMEYHVNIPRIMSIDHYLDIELDSNRWSNSMYLIEKYDFTKSFSLTGGARAEYSIFGGDRSYYSNSDMNGTSLPPPTITNTGTKINDSIFNYALELSPSYKIGEQSSIFAKIERGYVLPSPNVLNVRAGSSYNNVDVKDEIYDTLELGGRYSQDFQTSSFDILGSIFATFTHDENYISGNAHSSTFSYYPLKETRRAGVEIVANQSLLDGLLKFRESYTYIDARITNPGVASTKFKSNDKIPYVSNYKIGLFGEIDMGAFRIWINNIFNGRSSDGAMSSIKAYNISDIGISGDIKKLTLSVGVKNVFDTFYYSYFNSDSTDMYIPTSYIAANGRSFFLSGRYEF